MLKEYALYKGDTFIDLGTLEYLANKLGVKENTIYFYSTPIYRSRGLGEYGERYIAIKVEATDEALLDDLGEKREEAII